MEITKIKILKEKFIEVTVIQDDGSESTTHYKKEIHQDLKNAMVGLRIHLVILCNYVKQSHVKNITEYDLKLTEDVKVHGYSISGPEDEKSIILLGGLKTQFGKWQGLNSPLHDFIEAEDKAYKYMKALQERVEVIDDEVRLLINGKFAPDPQTTMEFPEEGGGNIED
jgi:hypothetical protein